MDRKYECVFLVCSLYALLVEFSGALLDVVPCPFQPELVKAVGKRITFGQIAGGSREDTDIGVEAFQNRKTYRLWISPYS